MSKYSRAPSHFAHRNQLGTPAKIKHKDMKDMEKDKFLVATRIDGKNAVFEFTSKKDARAFAKDARKKFGAETATTTQRNSAKPKPATLVHKKSVRSSEQLKGGLGDNAPDESFKKESLAAGQKVEMEHTNDPAVAREIAKDHLTEDKDYYKKLKKIEKPKLREDQTPESEEGRELLLYGENDAELYRQRTTPIQKNLVRKKEKGIYDHEKAVKLWQYEADDAAQRYVKEYSSTGDNPREIFPTAARKEYAEARAREFEVEYDLGNYDHLHTKQYVRAQQKSQPSNRLTLAQMRAGSKDYFFSPDAMRFFKGAKYSTKYDSKTQKNYIVVTHPARDGMSTRYAYYEYKDGKTTLGARSTGTQLM